MPDQPNHILFSVAGLTPAVITETLYGLLRQKDVRGGEIHILTTARGQHDMAVLLGDDGIVAGFNRAWNTRWEVHEEWIEAVTARTRWQTALPLDDLRDQRDNAAAADAVTERIRRFTSRPEVVLHASVAGGRKTLGLFVAQAMSWFARTADTLSHVLVPPEYEDKSLKFFYPHPEVPDEHGIVDFAELGFVRMRGLLPDSFLEADAGEQPRSYSELVRLSQVFLRDTLNRSGNLVLCRSKRCLEVDRALVLHLQPVSGALYEFLFLHANTARGQDPFAFREAFTYREALADCLRLWLLDPDLTTPPPRRRAGAGLSALAFREPDGPWPPRWSRGTGQVEGSGGKSADVLTKRVKELNDAFGNLNEDFKALPWSNASFRVQHGDGRGHGPSRLVDVAPERLRIVD